MCPLEDIWLLRYKNYQGHSNMWMEKLDNLLICLEINFVPSSEHPGSKKAIFLLLLSNVIKYNIVLKLSVYHSTYVLDIYM